MADATLWRHKGRAAAYELYSRWDDEGAEAAARRKAAEWAARDDHGPFLQGRYTDLLSAVRWAAGQTMEQLQFVVGEDSIGEVADDVEAEALRHLVEGFRERLRELAG